MIIKQENLNIDTVLTIIQRLLITISVVLIIRIGTFLPIPEIDHFLLAIYLQGDKITHDLIKNFSGKENGIIGLFTLNILPYINASILIQLLSLVFPSIEKLQREGDLEERRFINRLTRIIALILAIFQSIILAFYLKGILFNWSYLLAFGIVIRLTTGAMVVIWLSELITDYGLGNGPAILISTNIISNFPNFINNRVAQTEIYSIPEVVLFLFISIYGIIFLQDGTRLIPLITKKELTSTVSSQAGLNTYLPLRFNQAGILPIIISSTILLIPTYLNIPINFGFLYWILYFMLIVFFGSFYSSAMLNPKDISDKLRSRGASIPGIRPGLCTTFYLQQTVKRMAWVGYTMLAIIVTLPNFLESIFHLQFLRGLNVTSLILLVGVFSDLAREIKGIYYSNIYNSRYK